MCGRSESCGGRKREGERKGGVRGGGKGDRGGMRVPFLSISTRHPNIRNLQPLSHPQLAVRWSPTPTRVPFLVLTKSRRNSGTRRGTVRKHRATDESATTDVRSHCPKDTDRTTAASILLPSPPPLPLPLPLSPPPQSQHEPATPACSKIATKIHHCTRASHRKLNRYAWISVGGRGGGRGSRQALLRFCAKFIIKPLWKTTMIPRESPLCLLS